MAEVEGKSRGVWADIVRTASNLFRAEDFEESPTAEFRRMLERGEIGGRELSEAVLPGAGLLGTVAKRLPLFKHTEEALEFGAKYAKDKGVLDMLRRAREKSLSKIMEIRKKPRTMESMQEAMDEAIKGQFYREALEEAAEVGGR